MNPKYSIEYYNPEISLCSLVHNVTTKKDLEYLDIFPNHYSS